MGRGGGGDNAQLFIIVSDDDSSAALGERCDDDDDGGSSVIVDVDLAAFTMKDLQSAIEEETGISVGEQLLFVGDRLLTTATRQKSETSSSSSSSSSLLSSLAFCSSSLVSAAVTNVVSAWRLFGDGIGGDAPPTSSPPLSALFSASPPSGVVSSSSASSVTPSSSSSSSSFLSLQEMGIDDGCLIRVRRKLRGGGGGVGGGVLGLLREVRGFYNPFVGLGYWFFPCALNVYGIYKFRHHQFWENKPVLDASAITGEKPVGGGGGH